MKTETHTWPTTPLKPTPAPWSWEQWNDGIALCHNGSRLMGYFDNKNRKRDFPSEANAALIAKAPELLEALQDIAATQTLGRDIVWAVDRARAAVLGACLNGGGRN